MRQIINRQLIFRDLQLLGKIHLKSTFRIFLIALATLFSTALPTAAQVEVETARLKGTITDPNGAVVPNAAAQIVNTAQGIIRDAVTNESSIYQIPPL